MKNEKKEEAIPHEIKQEVPESIYLYGYDYIRKDKIDKNNDNSIAELTRELKVKILEWSDKERVKEQFNKDFSEIEDDDQISVVDCVVLKSGGEPMSVNFICENGDAACVWYRDNGSIGEATFDSKCLEKVEKEYIKRDLYCDKLDYYIHKPSDEEIYKAANKYLSNFFNPYFSAVRVKDAFQKGAEYMYYELTK